MLIVSQMTKYKYRFILANLYGHVDNNNLTGELGHIFGGGALFQVKLLTQWIKLIFQKGVKKKNFGSKSHRGGLKLRGQ